MVLVIAKNTNHYDIETAVVWINNENNPNIEIF